MEQLERDKLKGKRPLTNSCLVEEKKRNYNEIIFSVAVRTLKALLIWMSISCFVQAQICPKMTPTEVFQNIPNSFVMDWKRCD